MARRSNSIVPILTIALFIAVAAVAAYAFVSLSDDGIGDGEGRVASGESGDVDVPPPVRGPGDEALQTVPADQITVEASSFLAPAGDLTYDPENTLDADLQTAWNSDSDVEGRGDTLTYRFTEPIDLRAMQFVNGYAKDGSIWDKNHRIRTLVVRTDGATREISLLDTADQQQVVSDFGRTTELVIEVVDVYTGSGFESGSPGDLALTEIEFLIPAG